jgi:hypothetical protein
LTKDKGAAKAAFFCIVFAIKKNSYAGTVDERLKCLNWTEMTTLTAKLVVLNLSKMIILEKIDN